MKNQELKNLKEKFENEPKDFLTPIEKQIGSKIKEVKFLDDTEPFKLLIEGLKNYPFRLFNYMEPFVIMSLVEKSKGFTLKISNCITFLLPEGSLIRFSPIDEDTLEISRLEVSITGKGLGSLIMDFFLSYVELILGYHPKMIVEITGSVGMGKNQKKNDISKQKKFFEKFEFKQIKNDGVSILMERPLKWIEMS